MKGAPERKALRERAVALEMLAFPETTQPPGMPTIGPLADLGVAGALERRTMIQATQPSGIPMVGPTKLAEPQSRRGSETGHPHLVVAETEDGHGPAETSPLVVGMTGW
jgi:hypothetical protein